MSTPPHIHEIDDFSTQRCTVCGKYLGVAAPLEPSPPEIAALRQWERDTEKPASASEGNAFMDGFQAGKNHAAAVSKNLQEELRQIDFKLMAHYGHMVSIGKVIEDLEKAEEEIAALREKPSNISKSSL